MPNYCAIEEECILLKKLFGSAKAPLPRPDKVPAAEPHGKKAAAQARLSRRDETTKPVVEWTADQFQVPPEAGKTRFHDLDLYPSLLHGRYRF
jgi:ATP-dependent RNA helicase RhlB